MSEHDNNRTAFKGDAYRQTQALRAPRPVLVASSSYVRAERLWLRRTKEGTRLVPRPDTARNPKGES